jgi:hypothetical protein
MAQSTPLGLVCRHRTRVAYHVGDEVDEEDKGDKREQGLDTGRGPCIAYSASRHPLQHTCAAACRGDVTPPGATRTRASAGPASDTQTRTSSESLHPSLFIRAPSSESLHPSLFIRVSSSESLHPSLFIRVSSSESLHPSPFIRVSSSESLHPSLFIRVSGVIRVPGSRAR